MNRDELLAAVIAECQDYRWFATPKKTAADIPVSRDDDVTCARRRRTLESDMSTGRWVTRRGVQIWEETA